MNTKETFLVIKVDEFEDFSAKEKAKILKSFKKKFLKSFKKLLIWG